jgi:glycolate oxidase FAD binding subunit
MLIGLSFVRADGQLAKAGGRVVKNVAGYDMMKLLSGSYGSLGVICQVTLRTYPLPEASQSLIFSGSAAAVQQLSQAVRRSPLTPVALDLLSPALMAAAGLGADFGLAARFQSVALGVAEQSQRLLSLAQQLGLSGSLLSGDLETQFWAQSSAQLFSPQLPETSAIAKVGVLPAQAAALLSQVEALGGVGRIHAGSGVGHLQLEAPSAAALLSLRAEAQQARGYLSLLAGPPELKRAVEVWGYSGNALPLMRQLKQQFDPQQRLSPGRFVGGL